MEPRVLQWDSKGEGEPIVLVPGGLTGWISWVPHQERLAATHRAIRVQPIHNELGAQGISGDPAYDAATDRESLRLTLDELGLDRPHFAGWSAGGAGLLEFALAHPDRVRSLALVEPAAHWVLERLGVATPELDEMNDLVRRMIGQPVSEDDLIAFLRLGGIAEGDPRAHPNWDRWASHKTTLSWLTDGLMDPGRGLDELPQIGVPTLLTRGRASTDSDRRIVEELGARLPNARVEAFDGAHRHHIESIDAFLESLLAHLAAA